MYKRQLEKEIKKADATREIAQVIIGNAKVQLEAMKHMDEYGYNIGNKEKPAVPEMLMIK